MFNDNLRVAGLLVALPWAFDTMTRKVAPLSANIVAEVVYVAPVAPVIFELFFCH